MKDDAPAQNEFRVKRPNGEIRWCIGTAAPSVDAIGRVYADQRRHRGHHRPQGGRGTPGAAGARGRPPRQECARAGAIDRSADAGELHRGLHQGGRRAHPGAVARAHRPVAFALAGRRHPRAWSTRSSRPTAPSDGAKIVACRARTCRCSRRPRSRLRSRCTSSRPTPRNMARCLRNLRACMVYWKLTADALVPAMERERRAADQAPASPGFGTRIITASVEGQLGGQADLRLACRGLQCVLSVPRDDHDRRRRGRQRRRRTAGFVMHDRRDQPGRRATTIMVVEDEALVAMSLRVASTTGFVVVGPFSRITDAIDALDQRRVDAAVLDVNLGGELVYPLADALAADPGAVRFHDGLRRRGDRAAVRRHSRFCKNRLSRMP